MGREPQLCGGGGTADVRSFGLLQPSDPVLSALFHEHEGQVGPSRSQIHRRTLLQYDFAVSTAMFFAREKCADIGGSLQTSRDSDSLKVWAGMSTLVDTVDASTSGSEQHRGNDLDRISMSTNLPV